MEWLTIGELSERSGVATSALRFYETKGLIESERTDGNQRRYPRATLRRVALIRAGQEVGLSLAELTDALDAECELSEDLERRCLPAVGAALRSDPVTL